MFKMVIINIKSSRNIANLIFKYQINIISARDKFENLYPNNPLRWKQAMFEYIIRNRYNQECHCTNIEIMMNLWSFVLVMEMLNIWHQIMWLKN